MSARIGIRELRQNLRAVLERAENGERIVITSRNKPIAELGPLGVRSRTLAQLIAEGKATPARRGPPHDFKPLKIEGLEPDALSRALDYVRGED